jgi:predicted TIM-barrel fold metal-dependent hydrolase
VSVIDCDVHPYANSVDELLDYMPSGWRKRFEDYTLPASARGGDRYRNPAGGLRIDAAPPRGGLPGSDPAYMIEDLLDPFGIEIALLLPMQGVAVTSWTDPDAAAVMVSAVNDFVLEHWAALDSRYRLAIAVSPHDVQSAVDEVRRLKDDPRVAGIFLPLLNQQMGDPSFYPLYELVGEAGLVVVSHPTGAEGIFIGAPGFACGSPRTYPAWHSLLSQVAQSQVASLVFDGIHQRFPKLQVLFAEFGFSWIVPFLWRMDHEWQNFRYEVPWLDRRPSEIVKEFIRFGTQPIDEPEPRSELWELMRLDDAASLLVFSSDYPHYDKDDPDLVLGRIPSELRDGIARENAWSLLAPRLAG